MTNNSPIGIFDSGLGGLTVVRAIREALPREAVIYLGDTARVPYGNKSPALVLEYAQQITDFLLSSGAKMIVVACNTASALALEALRKTVEVPVIGVIEPGVETALKATLNHHIGVIGTIATVSSGSYETLLRKRNKTVKVISRPCPLFVPLVEEGWLEGDVTTAVIKHYLQPLNQAGVDTLILGCTHYPLLKPALQEQVNPGTVLVDSAEAVAAETARVLDKNGLRSDRSEKGTFNCFVTDLPARFETVAGRFLGTGLAGIETVHLP